MQLRFSFPNLEPISGRQSFELRGFYILWSQNTQLAMIRHGLGHTQPYSSPQGHLKCITPEFEALC